jgi:hypothetical protein
MNTFLKSHRTFHVVTDILAAFFRILIRRYAVKILFEYILLFREFQAILEIRTGMGLPAGLKQRMKAAERI